MDNPDRLYLASRVEGVGLGRRWACRFPRSPAVVSPLAGYSCYSHRPRDTQGQGGTLPPTVHPLRYSTSPSLSWETRANPTADGYRTRTDFSTIIRENSLQRISAPYSAKDYSMVHQIPACNRV